MEGRMKIHLANDSGRETVCGRRCDRLIQCNRDLTETWANGDHQIKVAYPVHEELANCRKCVG